MKTASGTSFHVLTNQDMVKPQLSTNIYIHIFIYIHEDWDKSSSFLYVGRVLSPKVGAGASLVFHQFVPK
jgi:hypothetical protein